MNGRVHPSRPGEASEPSARVRHRGSGRRGRIAAAEAGADGDVHVLFDGDPLPVSVAQRALQYLDDPSPTASQRVQP